MGLWDNDSRRSGLFGGGHPHSSGVFGENRGGIYRGKHHDGPGVFDEAAQSSPFGSRRGMWNPVDPYAKKVKSGIWGK